jgi:hypothetical protein
MAAALGNTADADTYAALATAIQAGFTARYADSTPDTQLGYAMPLALGVVPADRHVRRPARACAGWDLDRDLP